jgi:hypothetical protein
MILFEILLNGEVLCEAGVSEEDQLEAALVKLLGSDQPIFNITVFDPSNKAKESFESWKTEILKVGDEITIKLNPGEGAESYVSGKEDEHQETGSASTLFCSFCNKGNFEVQSLVAGNDSYICDECIVMCHDIVEDEKT